MRILWISLLAVLVTGPGMAQSNVDPYMGDWQGTVTINGKEQSVALFMIPRGDGRYEVRTVSAFNQRLPYLDQLRGVLQSGRGTWIDAIPFEVSRVMGTADNGVILDASLWSGAAGEQRAAGLDRREPAGDIRVPAPPKNLAGSGRETAG
jgi:hypothetical protein